MRKSLPLFAAGLLFLAFNSLPTRGAAPAEGIRPIVGTWIETLTSTSDPKSPAWFPPFQTLITYGVGGTQNGDAAIDLTPATLSGPTHGAWIAATEQNYLWTGRAFSFDMNGVPNGVYLINENILLSGDNNSYAGTGAFVIVNNGQVVYNGGGYKVTGTRVSVP